MAGQGTMSQVSQTGNNLQYIRQMMNMIRNSNNPQYALQQMIQSDPRMQNVMNIIRQNGGDPRTAFYNLAQQKGVDPEEVLRMLR